MQGKIAIGSRCPYYLDLDMMAVVETTDSSRVIPLGAQPLLNIAGTDFYVEINSQSLIEVGDPSNIISFTDMTDMGSHYTMCYHLEYKNWPCQLDDPKKSINITIPPLAVLDPEGMARKYNTDVDGLLGKADIEFLNPNYEGFLARISGQLPHIDIAGHDYIIDIDKRELRLQGNSDCRLGFADFEEGAPWDDFSYRFMYDTSLQRAVPDIAQAAHATIVVVEIPGLFRVDPVGLARKSGYSDSHYIREYPIEKNLAASIRSIDGKDLLDGTTETDRPSKNRKRGQRL